MIRAITALHRIKLNKREQALKTLQLKRQQKREAEANLLRAREAVIESKRTLPARIDAVYEPVYGTICDQGDLDDLRGQVVQLEAEHQLLVDAEARAAHIDQRLAGEVAQAIEAYAQADRIQEKYAVLKADMLAEIAAEAEAKEDAEVEDLFAKASRRIA